MGSSREGEADAVRAVRWDADVAAVLREIAALRSGLEIDLSVAAGALEADAPHLAASVLGEGRREVARVQSRLSALLDVPAPAPSARPPAAWGRRPVAITGVAALTLSLLLAPGSGSGLPAPAELPSPAVSLDDFPDPGT
jgi:hypothetical protein